MEGRLVQRTGLLFLTLLILLQIFDFLKIMPADLEAIGKIISWITFGCLFVQVSLSEILFGHKKIRFDMGIILVYFLFIVKDITSYAKVSMEEAILFKGFYLFLLNNYALIERYCFYLGGILLLFISVYMALRFAVKQPSFMAVLHEVGNPPKDINKIFFRAISVFFVLIAFFVFVFNLAVEWLAIALDTQLVVIAILVYFFIIVKYHEKFHASHFIYKIGHTGEEFYKNFIRMFH